MLAMSGVKSSVMMGMSGTDVRGHDADSSFPLFNFALRTRQIPHPFAMTIYHLTEVPAGSIYGWLRHAPGRNADEACAANSNTQSHPVGTVWTGNAG
eukprot:358981-Rhodomonas_salina.3